MKLIIAGSRHIDWEDVYAEIVKLRPTLNATEIVSGGAKGADYAGERYAEFYDIPLKKFPANWFKHGKAAGPIRNEEMARYADALLLIWDGKSKGSLNMRRWMQVLNKPVYEVVLDTCTCDARFSGRDEAEWCARGCPSCTCGDDNV